ncbi:hypothetical protein ACM92K_003153 [Cronobacter turicensis]
MNHKPLNKRERELLTDADCVALAAMPDSGWFKLMGRWSSSVNRPQFLLDRLTAAGRLERRVTGVYPDLVSEYRKNEGGAA